MAKCDDPLNTTYTANSGTTVQFDEDQRDVPFKKKFPYFQYSRGDSGGYIEFNNVMLDPNIDFTLDFWFLKWESNWSRILEFYIGDSQQLMYVSTNKNSNFAGDLANLTDIIWHHFAVCYDSTINKRTVYLDGSIIGQSGSSFNWPTYNPLPALYLGKSAYSDPLANIIYQLIRIDYNCIFKEEFNCHDIHALKYPGTQYLINNLSIPTLAS